MQRVAITTVLIALAAQSTPADWVRQTAVPIVDVDTWRDFDDLQPLKQLIGDARIVALGEGTHGTHEFFAMKRRVTEFLAREMGFTIFAMEGNLPEAGAIDDYIRTGAGDPATVVKGLQMWPWTTEELTDLVRWMRTYRARGGAMTFSGVDVQLPAAGQQIVDEFLATADPSSARARRRPTRGSRLPSVNLAWPTSRCRRPDSMAGASGSARASRPMASSLATPACTCAPTMRAANRWCA